MTCSGCCNALKSVGTDPITAQTACAVTSAIMPQYAQFIPPAILAASAAVTYLYSSNNSTEQTNTRESTSEQEDISRSCPYDPTSSNEITPMGDGS